LHVQTCKNHPISTLRVSKHRKMCSIIFLGPCQLSPSIVVFYIFIFLYIYKEIDDIIDIDIDILYIQLEKKKEKRYIIYT
jgi:hypothetical protein